MPTSIKRGDLIVLGYASNPCEVKLTEEVPYDIRVDLEAGTWSYKDKRRNGIGLHEFKIGAQYRHCEFGCRGGVIGVYDRTHITDLRAMLFAAIKAIEDRGSLLEG